MCLLAGCASKTPEGSEIASRTAAPNTSAEAPEAKSEKPAPAPAKQTKPAKSGLDDEDNGLQEGAISLNAQDLLNLVANASLISGPPQDAALLTDEVINYVIYCYLNGNIGKDPRISADGMSESGIPVSKQDFEDITRELFVEKIANSLAIDESIFSVDGKAISFQPSDGEESTREFIVEDTGNDTPYLLVKGVIESRDIDGSLIRSWPAELTLMGNDTDGYTISDGIASPDGYAVFDGTTPDQSGTYISLSTQEYDGTNIVEIPYIVYAEDRNPEIDSLNRSINQGLQMIYEDFLVNQSDGESIEIRSYPFTTDKYLQVVVTYIAYPIYGTDGDMFSINYDRTTGKAMSVLDLGLSEDELLYEVGQAFVPESEGALIDEVRLVGFLMHETENGDIPELLLQIAVDTPGADIWEGFYS
jgi:hypothetical protein